MGIDNQHIWERLEPVAQSMDLEIVDIEQVSESNQRFFRVYIFHPDRLDLDACERFHRAIVDLLDDVDYDFLEVSTPGNRPFKTQRDYERNYGKSVVVTLKSASEEGKKSYTGVLEQCTEETLTLTMPKTERVDIARAGIRHVKPDFSI